MSFHGLVALGGREDDAFWQKAKVGNLIPERNVYCERRNVVTSSKELTYLGYRVTRRGIPSTMDEDFISPEYFSSYYFTGVFLLVFLVVTLFLNSCLQDVSSPRKVTSTE